MENKKVLILGSYGMLGQELVKVFSSDEKYTVTGWDFGDIDITHFVDAEKKIALFLQISSSMLLLIMQGISGKRMMESMQRQCFLMLKCLSFSSILQKKETVYLSIIRRIMFLMEPINLDMTKRHFLILSLVME